MKTREQILEIIANGRESNCIDGRDYYRLVRFFPVSNWKVLGCEKTDQTKPDPEPIELTKENVLKQLAKDVAFGFEKALDKRGISSSLMYEVVRMWLWVLDDEQLYNDNEYGMYGLALFKKVAVKYNLKNEIGEDHGYETKYSNDYFDE